MFTIRYSAPAKGDLAEIADYLEREASARIAKTVVQRIRAHIRKLERDAHRHRERKELGAGRRATRVEPYLVFYRIEADTVFVLRVLHGARNITPGLFG